MQMVVATPARPLFLPKEPRMFVAHCFFRFCSVRKFSCVRTALASEWHKHRRCFWLFCLDRYPALWLGGPPFGDAAKNANLRAAFDQLVVNLPELISFVSSALSVAQSLPPLQYFHVAPTYIVAYLICSRCRLAVASRLLETRICTTLNRQTCLGRWGPLPVC